MLTNLSIKTLYAPALAEGEGVGTAYEYFAKRLVLAPWLRRLPHQPRSLLVAGLPQKYGASLDFLLLAAELGAAVTVVDERPSALQKLRSALAAWQADGWLPGVAPKLEPVPSLTQLDGVEATFDLAISSEVLQRLTAAARAQYVQQLQQAAPALALFAPNADNPAHTNLSGLDGLHLAEMQALFPAATAVTGYIDMPPFPPGIVRDDAQREQASNGRLEAVAMWGLGYYARLERFLPRSIRRRHSHIVYALVLRATSPGL